MPIDELLEAPATYAIMVVTTLVSLVGFWVRSREKDRRHFVFRAYDVARGKNLLGAVVSHLAHGDFGHLAVNMLVLYLFGPQVEVELGLPAYLAVYAVSGLVGTLALFALHYKNRKHSALGASGAIAGVVFAMVIIAPESEYYLFFVPVGIPAPIFALLYLVVSSLMAGRGDQVAHEAHIGGAVAGLAMAGLLYGPGFQPLIRAVTRLIG